MSTVPYPSYSTDDVSEDYLPEDVKSLITKLENDMSSSTDETEFAEDIPMKIFHFSDISGLSFEFGKYKDVPMRDLVHEDGLSYMCYLIRDSNSPRTQSIAKFMYKHIQAQLSLEISFSRVLKYGKYKGKPLIVIAQTPRGRSYIKWLSTKFAQFQLDGAFAKVVYDWLVKKGKISPKKSLPEVIFSSS